MSYIKSLQTGTRKSRGCTILIKEARASLLSKETQTCKELCPKIRIWPMLFSSLPQFLNSNRRWMLRVWINWCNIYRATRVTSRCCKRTTPVSRNSLNKPKACSLQRLMLVRWLCSNKIQLFSLDLSRLKIGWGSSKKKIDLSMPNLNARKDIRVLSKAITGLLRSTFSI